MDTYETKLGEGEDFKERVKTFLEINKKYIDEKEAARQRRIASLAGENPTQEDINSAENLIEAEVFSDETDYRKSLKAGYITFVPPYRRARKGPMVGLDISDPLIFKLFNDACSQVTKEHSGFHQVGWGQTKGYTAWELWSLNGKKSYQFIEAVYQKMREINGIE